MIQVFRHIENKPSSVFNTFQKRKEGRTWISFLKNQCWLRRGRKEEVLNQRMGSGNKHIKRL